jgi:hypothetical protein
VVLSRWVWLLDIGVCLGGFSWFRGQELQEFHCVCIVLGIIKASCCVFHNVLDSGRPSKPERCKPAALACVFVWWCYQHLGFNSTALPPLLSLLLLCFEVVKEMKSDFRYNRKYLSSSKFWTPFVTVFVPSYAI